ncbi:O-antigen ligase family protein [Vogesella sp. GCM10023246]|uniref:O-antigen ligase family protein n=1 Tax=Vogesella oryzagri TaxID=3160864 RepID=A0ABV1M0B9_9NEIS
MNNYEKLEKISSGFLLLVVAFFFATAMSVKGGANLSVFLLFLISFFYLKKQKIKEQVSIFLVLALPFFLSLTQLLLGYDIPINALDSPLRMALAAFGVFSLVWVRTDDLLKSVALVVVGVLGVAVWAYLSTHYSHFAWGLNGQSGQRAWNGFSNPIPFGVLSVMLGFVAVLLPLESLGVNSNFSIVIKLVSLSCGLFSGYLSVSRSIILVVPFLMLIVAFYYFQNSFKKAILCLVLMMIGTSSAIMFSQSFMKTRIEAGIREFATINKNMNNAVGLRVEMWRVAGEIIEDNFLFGIGKSGYHQKINEMIIDGDASPFIKKAPHPHNELLTMGVEMGIFGIIAGGLLYFFPLWFFIAALRQQDEVKRFAGAAGATVCVTFFIAGLIDSYFWIVSLTSVYAVCVTVFFAMLLARKRELTSASACFEEK